ncbi:MAG: cyclase family protein [Thermoleophilia bacterium]
MSHPIDPVDLTQPVRSGMPVYPGDPPVAVTPGATHETHGYAASRVELGTHSGTHLDAPFHFFPDGARLDAYPAGRFFGTGLVLDLRRAGLEIGEPAVLAAAEEGGGLRPGDFAVVWTGWDAHFGEDTMVEHPYLTPDAARMLVAAGVSLVATDALNIDASTGEDYLVHLILLGADVLIVENLRALESLGAGRASFAFLPLRLEGADGAPVRAVGWKD